MVAYKASNNALAGIGYVFSRDDPYCGVDLDHTDVSEILAVQVQIFNEMDSYS